MGPILVLNKKLGSFHKLLWGFMWRGAPKADPGGLVHHTIQKDIFLRPMWNVNLRLWASFSSRQSSSRPLINVSINSPTAKNRRVAPPRSARTRPRVGNISDALGGKYQWRPGLLGRPWCEWGGGLIGVHQVPACCGLWFNVSRVLQLCRRLISPWFPCLPMNLLTQYESPSTNTLFL